MAPSNKAQNIRDTLAEKSWFGFDLDDTLHEFRRASSAATAKAIESISQRHGTPTSVLQEAYSDILRDKTFNAFSDGKTSFEYRRDRFSTLLGRFSLPQDASFLEDLLDVYEITLNESLQLKDGALSLLHTLKRLRKKVAVITEGPQDAQERTVRRLGIDQHIDFLATTNFFGVSKTDGLFPKVLQHLEIPAANMAYVGDNPSRDVVPAVAEGIFGIYLNEKGENALDSSPPQINSLGELEKLVST